MNTGAVAAAVAAYGLPGSRLAMPEEPLDAGAWSALLLRVEEQRLAGFLVHAIGQGAFPATAEQADEAAECHIRSMAVALMLDRLLLDVVDAFDKRGIDHRVLKGSAYAHLDYLDPALRSFGDIDVLVASDQYDEAVAALGAVKGRRRVPEIRPGFDRRFGKGGSFVTDDGLEIDLHRLFVGGPLGLSIRVDDLFGTYESFVVGGRELRALGRELRFLHSCYHAALGSSPSPRLLALRDVAQMLLHPGLDVAAVQQLCTRWQAEAVAAQAIRWTWATLDLADVLPLTVWAQRYEPDKRAEADLRLYRPGVPFSAQAAAAVSAIPGLRAKAAYVRALALPSPGYRVRALRSLPRLLPQRRRRSGEDER